MATDDVLDRLEKLLAEATPGPWECGGFGGIRMDGTRDLYTVMHGPLRVCSPPLGPGNGREQRRDDMQAVAALRNAAPALIRLARAAKTWREWGGHCDTCEFVRQKAANPVLPTELFADYCDCGWHEAGEAIKALGEEASR